MENPSWRDKVHIATVSRRVRLASSTRFGPVGILELIETFACQGGLMASGNSFYITWKGWTWPFTHTHQSSQWVSSIYSIVEGVQLLSGRGGVSECCTRQGWESPPPALYYPCWTWAVSEIVSELGQLGDVLQLLFSLLGLHTHEFVFIFKSLKTKVWISIRKHIG